MDFDRFALTVPQRSDSTNVVAVSGEVDMATAPEFRRVLCSFHGGDVVVDLSAVTYLDSSGLNALTVAHQVLESRKSKLTVRGATPMTLRLLEVTALDQYLHIDGS
jgi:anti-sigma B factor antagonist